MTVKINLDWDDLQDGVNHFPVLDIKHSLSGTRTFVLCDRGWDYMGMHRFVTWSVWKDERGVHAEHGDYISDLKDAVDNLYFRAGLSRA